MNYLVVEHLRGSKANQVEEFPLSLYPELLIGRDLDANVRFTDAETVVGRQHLKISQGPNDSTQFLIKDLNSRNGTFVNGQRVLGSTVLRSGDVVRCGPDGPEFRFKMRPSTEPLGSGSALPGSALAGSAMPDPPIESATPAANFALAHLANPGPQQSAAPRREEPIATAAQFGESTTVRLRKPILVGAGVLGLLVLAAGVVGYRALTATGADQGPTTASPIAASQVEPTPSPVVGSAAVPATVDPAPGVRSTVVSKTTPRPVGVTRSRPPVASPVNTTKAADKPVDGTGKKKKKKKKKP